MAVKVLLNVELLKLMVQKLSVEYTDGLPSGYQQLLDGWARRGETDIDLTELTYELKPIIRVEDK